MKSLKKNTEMPFMSDPRALAQRDNLVPLVKHINVHDLKNLVSPCGTPGLFEAMGYHLTN